ncbi:MAG: universal stress protein [Jatrophihabitantaceae bacterium]
MAERYAIVVAVDGSASSRAAARWAATEAVRRDCGVFVVHVHEQPHTDQPSPLGLPEQLREFSQPVVDEAVELVRAAAPDIPVAGRVYLGSPVWTLLAISEQADLLVLGRRGMAVPTAQPVGATTIGIAARAHCPVVAVPVSAAGASSPAGIGSAASRRIVIGLADRPTWGRALDFAIEEAARQAAPLLAVRACNRSTAACLDPMLTRCTQLTEVSHLLAAHLTDRTPKVVATPVVRADRPAGLLSELCRPDDLLVLGQHRHASYLPSVLGGVIADCLRQAPCPVAIVPEPAVTAEQPDQPWVAEAGDLITS